MNCINWGSASEVFILSSIKDGDLKEASSFEEVEADKAIQIHLRKDKMFPPSPKLRS